MNAFGSISSMECYILNNENRQHRNWSIGERKKQTPQTHTVNTQSQLWSCDEHKDKNECCPHVQRGRATTHRFQITIANATVANSFECKKPPASTHVNNQSDNVKGINFRSNWFYSICNMKNQQTNKWTALHELFVYGRGHAVYASEMHRSKDKQYTKNCELRHQIWNKKKKK